MLFKLSIQPGVRALACDHKAPGSELLTSKRGGMEVGGFRTVAPALWEMWTPLFTSASLTHMEGDHEAGPGSAGLYSQHSEG